MEPLTKKDIKALQSLLKKHVQKKPVKKEDKELYGKRKLYYVSIASAVILIITTVILFLYKERAKEIISMQVVYIFMFVIGFYPLSNVLNKLFTKIGTKKIYAILKNLGIFKEE